MSKEQHALALDLTQVLEEGDRLMEQTFKKKMLVLKRQNLLIHTNNTLGHAFKIQNISSCFIPLLKNMR